MRADLIGIGILVLVICGVIAYDPNGVFEWLAQRKEAQFDEFLMAAVVIGVGFAFFLWRRWAELGRQVLEYQRLQQELSAFNRSASQLSETDDALQSCLTAEEAYNVVISHLQSALPASSGAICAITPARDLVEARARWGSPALADGLFPPKDCWGLRRGRVNISGASNPKLICGHIAPTPAYAMWVPMMAQGETLGVLYLDSGSEVAARSKLPAPRAH